MTRTNQATLAAGVVLAALLAGCGDSKPEVPKGQVVATVNGDDITIHELNGEVATLPNKGQGAPRKLVETVALSRVVERKMLADVARERKLDKNPQFILQQRRVEEGLLVQALQSDIAGKVPGVTREAAQKYVVDNPSLFGDRKIFVIDQIQFLRPANIEQLGFGPAKTLADVERILVTNNIEYRRQPATIDALTVDPKLTAEVTRITSRDPNEVFMFADQPAGAPVPVMYVNQVTQINTKPFIGERAIGFATQLLQRQAVQKSLTGELERFKTVAKEKISYAEGYSAAPKPGSPEAKKMLDDARKQMASEAAKRGGTAGRTAGGAASPPAAAPAAAPAATAPAAN